jgi:hypothetical protein
MIILVGQRSGEPFSYRGRVLLHDGPLAEVEYLIAGPRYVQLPGTAQEVAERLGRPVMMIRDHPAFASIRWPIRKGDFYA